MRKISILFLLSAVFLLTDCKKQPIQMWETLCVKEGQHAYKPYRLNWESISSLAYKFQFSTNDDYDLMNSDQCDWNKLTGLSFHFETNLRDAIMVAYRWDTDGYYWIAPYYHKNEETFYAPAPCTGYSSQSIDPDFEALKLYPDEEVEVYFNIFDPARQTASVTIFTPNGSSYLEIDFDFPINNTREINTWFGGNQSAPKDMCVYRFLLGRE